MQEITLLHISDLHFTTSTVPDEKNALALLIQDIRSKLPNTGHGPRCDAIFITGDIANQGQDNEYSNPDLARFVSDLAALAGGDRRRLFFAPGNHDANWNLDARDLKIPKDAGNYAWQDTEELLSTPYVRERLNLKFGPFWDFVDSMRSQTTRRGPAQFYRLYDPVDLGGSECGFEEVRLEVVALNSALNCGPDRRGDPLVVSAAQWQAAFAGLPPQNDSSPAPRLRVAILHHPPHSLEECDSFRLREALRDNDFWLVLHGHTHIGESPRLASCSQPIVIVGSGSTITKPSPSANGFLRSYNIVRINPVTAEGCIRARHFTLERQWIDLDPKGTSFSIPMRAGRRPSPREEEGEIHFLAELTRLIDEGLASDNYRELLRKVLGQGGLCELFAEPISRPDRGGGGSFILKQRVLGQVLTTTFAEGRHETHSQSLQIPDLNKAPGKDNPSSVAGQAFAAQAPFFMPNLEHSEYVYPLNRDGAFDPADPNPNAYQHITHERGFFGSLFCVPVRSRLGVKGVVNYYNTDAVPLDRRQAARLDVLAALLGMLDHKIALEYALVNLQLGRSREGGIGDAETKYRSDNVNVLAHLNGELRPKRPESWVTNILEPVISAPPGGTADVCGVIFDVDGVILRTRDDKIAAIAEILAPFFPWKDILDQGAGETEDSFIAELDLSCSPTRLFENLLDTLKQRQEHAPTDKLARLRELQLAIEQKKANLSDAFGSLIALKSARFCNGIRKQIEILKKRSYSIAIVASRPVRTFSPAQREAIDALESWCDVGPLYPEEWQRESVESCLVTACQKLCNLIRGGAESKNVLLLSTSGDALRAAADIGMQVAVASWDLRPDDRQLSILKSQGWDYHLRLQDDIAARFSTLSAHRTMEIRDILFDLDNTLLDSRDLTLAAYRYVLHDEFGIDELLEHDLSGFAIRVLEELLRSRGQTPDRETLRKLREDFREALINPKLMADYLKPDTAVIRVLKELRRRRYHPVVVTSKPEHIAIPHMIHVGLGRPGEGLIDGIVAQDERQGKHGKPDPQPIREAILLLDELKHPGVKDTQPVHVMYVGDSVSDIHAAHSAGVHPAAATWWLWGGKTKLNRKANESLLKKYEEDLLVHNPHVILRKIEDLLRYLECGFDPKAE